MRLDLGTLAILKVPWMKRAHLFQHNGTAMTFEQYSHSKGTKSAIALKRHLKKVSRKTFPASDAVSVVQPAPPAPRGYRE